MRILNTCSIESCVGRQEGVSLRHLSSSDTWGSFQYRVCSTVLTSFCIILDCKRSKNRGHSVHLLVSMAAKNSGPRSRDNETAAWCSSYLQKNTSCIQRDGCKFRHQSTPAKIPMHCFFICYSAVALWMARDRCTQRASPRAIADTSCLV